MVFTKGDSNRCRNAYEKILHDKLPSNVLNVHKKNKHISVGRCRHIAIVHGVALPPYELLSEAGFELEGVRDWPRLLDAPGLHDDNAARDGVMASIVQEADCLLVVSNIRRACNDKGAKDLLSLPLRRALLASGFGIGLGLFNSLTTLSQPNSTSPGRSPVPPPSFLGGTPKLASAI